MQYKYQIWLIKYEEALNGLKLKLINKLSDCKRVKEP